MNTGKPATTTAAKLVHVLRFFGAGVIDQVLLSGASFIAGFLMIRYTSDVDYGQFVLAQSAVLLLVSAQGAWLSGPLAAIVPSKPAATKRLMIGAVRASQSRFLRWVAVSLLAIAVTLYATGFLSASLALVSGTTILAGWATLQREYLRSVLIIYSRPHWMLRADTVYVICLVAGIALAAYLRHSAGVCAIFALVISAWAGMLVSHRMLSSDPGWISGDARPFLQEMRALGVWATVGAVTYWLFAQSYNYVLATRLNLTAVASVNAARLVIVPVTVFSLGINNVLMPLAANWLAQFGLARMLRRLAVVALAIIALDLVYISLAWIFRDWIIGSLLHKTIADRDRLLVLWACVALIFLPREVLQAGLFALRRVKSMARLIGLSAVVSLTLMWFGTARWGAAAVLIGQLAGECVNLVGLSWLVWIQVRLQSES
ncbi:MAG: lipopolysaccharide biosynthesis protein [Steroidobacteraceae bacterium]|jgi:O-antigen/teichoic acid export membrane protein